MSLKDKYNEFKKKLENINFFSSPINLDSAVRSDSPYLHNGLINNYDENIIERKTDKEKSVDDLSKLAEEERTYYGIKRSNNATENTVTPLLKALVEYFNPCPLLESKIDDFINWYKENLSGESGYDYKEDDLKNFIEKVAVWYELRYPDEIVLRLVDESEDMDKAVKEYDKSMSDLLSAVPKSANYHKFYNTKSFINSLPVEEKMLFNRPQYQDQVPIYTNGKMLRFYLTSNGNVRTLGGSEKIVIIDKNGGFSYFENINIEDLKETLENDPIYKLDENNEALENAIRLYKNEAYFKQELLNSIMYRIIERGQNRIGPRRGLLFAKEFKADINIPVMYGIDFSDSHSDKFINESIKSGVSTSLICYPNYFDRENKKIEKMSVEEVLEIMNKLKERIRLERIRQKKFKKI